MGRYKKVAFVVSDGVPYIALVFLLALLITLSARFFADTALVIIAVVAWLLALEVTYFFRDPERYPPQGSGLVVSPADGKVIDIRTVEEEKVIKGTCIRISIFMNIFDVHVNRAPLAGEITYLHYNPGKFISAFNEKASLDNEQVALGICGETGGKRTPIMVKLIAGLIARRIVLWKDMGQTLKQGERMSLIKFGSRVEIFLPPNATISVRVGDRVKAGETVMASLG
ncbi:MAG TPA: phosphatidylserine decarboxylase family protein [Thermodesulfobacteriota bacterium]|nr:phosphatidylserine decarboxylase family protein [Thermodesulfobacteriota bacterium]